LELDRTLFWVILSLMEGGLVFFGDFILVEGSLAFLIDFLERFIMMFFLDYFISNFINYFNQIFIYPIGSFIEWVFGICYGPTQLQKSVFTRKVEITTSERNLSEIC
jgi:hypothetical protein